MDNVTERNDDDDGIETDEWSTRLAAWSFLGILVCILLAVGWAYLKAAGIPLP